MSSINAVWHAAHRMPRNATLEQRVHWHVDHARNCGCWPELPPPIVAELKRRRIRLPRPRRRAPTT
jgi:hypothetical protein